jgi:hypothetical protein
VIQSIVLLAVVGVGVAFIAVGLVLMRLEGRE